LAWLLAMIIKAQLGLLFVEKRRNDSHIKAVGDLWLFVLLKVFHDLPDLSRALNDNRIPAVELGVVPVHLSLLRMVRGIK